MAWIPLGSSDMGTTGAITLQTRKSGLVRAIVLVSWILRKWKRLHIIDLISTC